MYLILVEEKRKFLPSRNKNKSCKTHFKLIPKPSILQKQNINRTEKKEELLSFHSFNQPTNHPQYSLSPINVIYIVFVRTLFHCFRIESGIIQFCNFFNSTYFLFRKFYNSIHPQQKYINKCICIFTMKAAKAARFG